MHFRSALFPLLLLLASVPTASAQTAFDVTKCFPDLLRKVTFTNDVEKSNLSLLSIVDQRTFHDAGMNTSLTTAFKGLPWNASFGAWDTARQSLYSELGINESQFRQLITRVSEVDPQATQIIHDCLTTQLAAMQYGLMYMKTIVDERRVILTFYWRPTLPGQHLYVKASTLSNASVTSLPEQSVLFPVRKSFWKHDPEITDGLQIELNRQKVNSAITATITTNPSIVHDPIVIERLAPPVQCQTVWHRNDSNGQPYRVHLEPRVRDKLYHDSSYWRIEAHLPAEYPRARGVNVDCHKLTPTSHWEIYYDARRPRWVADTAYCEGWTQTDETATASFDAYFEVPEAKCSEIPWKESLAPRSFHKKISNSAAGATQLPN